MDLHWWGLDPIRVELTGRGSRSTRVVLELGSGARASDAAELLAGIAKSAPAQPWAPIGSVVLVAAGAGAHPGVGPAVDTARQVWPAAVTVTVVDEAVAALAGAGLDPEPAACVVVHLDAEHTSVAVVAARKVVASGVVLGGAQGLAQAVIGYLRTEHRLDVGMGEAWVTAVNGGAFTPSASPPAGPWTVSGEVAAEDGTDQQWGSVAVPPAKLRAVLSPAYQSVADLVAQVLLEAPPETARQAVDGGLLLTGQHPAGADEHLAALCGLPARRTVEPEKWFERLRTLLNGVDRLLGEAETRP